MSANKTKFIVVSSIAAITIASMNDYFNRKANWKGHFLFKSIVIPPMIWSLSKFISSESSERDMNLLFIGALISCMSKYVNKFSINISYDYEIDPLPGPYLNNINQRTYEPVIPENMPRTNDPVEHVSHNWQTN
jgi:hypothetical protein